MKREIKFRAWDKENKTMIYPEQKENDRTADITLNAWCDSENDRSILMQFTGLHDLTGKEIFEGDIVKFIDDETMPNFYPEIKSEVFWWNEFSKFDLKCTHKELHFMTQSDFEVIGNIHSNPELL